MLEKTIIEVNKAANISSKANIAVTAARPL
jgi:hypothetical protein